MRATIQSGKTLHFQKLKIEVHPSREAAGIAAARAAGEALRSIAATRESFGVIFATGASQLETLRALREINHLPWGQVYGFNMDDYVGLPDDHPASFPAYLRRELPQKVRMKKFLEVDGTAPDVEQMCRDYAKALRAADPQLCLLGIGENGHLAFNDPGEANFGDPFDVRTVHLDTMCRQQQAFEGWFETYEDVPERAVTLTIPALFRVPKLILSVPGKRKARIVRRTIMEPISRDCPSTILRTHPDVTIYLDEDSATELFDLEWDADE
ncbi:MAG TPA: 6-phosphogluconolactonase [Terracidiphilus sp.]|jgi:glucosamine-6-phosphate deaminase